MISVIFADGTWSRPGARSIPGEALRQILDPKRFEFRYVRYPSAFGMATGVRDVSYAESVAVGSRAMAAAVRDTPHPAIVAGYSQGAAVAVNFARGLPKYPALDVRAVATLGDPHTPVHNGRSGIAGALTVPRKRLTVWADGDPIADLPLGSPARGVADMSRWMSAASPEAARAWAFKTAQELPTRVQRWWEPWRWPDIGRAPEDLRNYLGTAHTLDYVSHGHVRRLARMIEEVAR
ncbi:alpha/beta fold hydrolase [Gordonia rubripertincta]|uniref:Alpha/beta fold hydrolase n=1 Tax=Gordonia rubripertincta TaxID=36822 RepID=A0AAW4GBP5_GORRU|nr:alpha/beta fold hydrolase [Gordonia rubripertincta]